MPLRHSPKVEPIYDEGGNFVAMWLGADFTAEHEWGIKGIYGVLGVDTSKLGVKGRTVRNKDAILYLHGKALYLMNEYYYVSSPETVDRLDDNKELFTWRDGESALSGMWSGDAFCVALKHGDAKLSSAFYDLWSASQKGDLAIWVGGGDDKNPFSRGGLILAIVSRLDKATKDSLVEYDKQQREVERTEKKFKFQDKARKKHGWHCNIHPRWIEDLYCKDDLKPHTKYNVVYWFSVKDRGGYTTIESLQEWFNKGTGSVAELISEKNGAR